MKGIKLYILVLLACIIGLLILMFIATGGKLNSWSEADLTTVSFMLVIILSCISKLLSEIKHFHIDKDKIILSRNLPKIEFPKGLIPKIYIGETNTKLKHLFEIASWSFLAVAAFGLSGVIWIKILHYIATAFAALVVFIIVINTNDKPLVKTLYSIALFSGVFFWVVGLLNGYFNWNLWTVYFGEAAFLAPCLVWFLSQVTNEKIIEPKGL